MALAAILRLPLVFSGIPYISSTDEGGVLHPVTRPVRSGGWDPGWHQYPSLSMYLTAGVLHASRPIYRLVHGRPLASDLPPEEDLYDLIAPPIVILSGRGVVAAASLITILLGMALAHRLAGVLLAAENLRSIPGKDGPSSSTARRHALLAGALAGFAAASKYPAGARRREDRSRPPRDQTVSKTTRSGSFPSSRAK